MNTTAIGPVLPLTVRVGEKYRFLTGSYITVAKIEKIDTDMHGCTVLFISVKEPQKWMTWKATSISGVEFRNRILHGGLMEAEI